MGRNVHHFGGLRSKLFTTFSRLMSACRYDIMTSGRQHWKTKEVEAMLGYILFVFTPVVLFLVLAGMCAFEDRNRHSGQR
jgi:hypothetical protein